MVSPVMFTNVSAGLNIVQQMFVEELLRDTLEGIVEELVDLFALATYVDRSAEEYMVAIVLNHYHWSNDNLALEFLTEVCCLIRHSG